MVDIDDLQFVYIEYMKLDVLEQDLFEVMGRIILAKKNFYFSSFIDLV